jgi:hypothetical protein
MPTKTVRNSNARFSYRFSMFQNVLDDIISVLVLEQRVNAGVQLVQDQGGLLQGTVL